MDEQNKKIVFGVISFILAAIIIVFIIKTVNDNSNKVDIPDDFGTIELDEDGEEILGDIEDQLFNDDGTINKEYGTFIGEEAKKMKANHKFSVYVAEKELDETVINKKALFVKAKKDEDPSILIDYAITYLTDYMTDGADKSIDVWFNQSNDVYVNLTSSVYTGIMTDYFPVKRDPEREKYCTDHHVDSESGSKSIGLILKNVKSIANTLVDKPGNIIFYSNGYPEHIEGVTDEAGIYIK